MKELCIHNHDVEYHPNCFRKGLLKPVWWKDKRIGFLDIEASNLHANFGRVHCWVIKEWNKKVYNSGQTIVKPSTSIKSLLKKFHDSEESSLRCLCGALREYDIIVTWYGDRFDLPYLRSRAVKYGLKYPVEGEVYQHDLYFSFRNRFRINSNRLDSAARFLNCPFQKTLLDPDIWDRAQSWDTKALHYIYRHCVKDVDVLEWVFNKILPYIKLTKRSL